MRRQFWRSRTFKFWFLSCICILLLPMLTSGFYYSNIQTKLREKSCEISQMAIRQAAEVIDENLGMLCNVGDFIYTSSEIKRIKYLSLPYDAETYYELHKRSAFLTNFSFQTDLFDSLYVYYGDMHCLMDGQRLFTEINQITRILRERIHMTEADFVTLTAQPHYNHFHLLQDGTLLFLRTLSTRGTEKQPIITLVAVVNTDFLTSVLEETGVNTSGSAWLLTPEGLGLGTSAFLAAYGDIVSQPQSGELNEHLIEYVPSERGSWIYVLAQPDDAYLIDVVRSRNLFIGASMLALAVGFVFCYVLTVRHYRPVHALKQRVGAQTAAADDFALIDSKLSELMAAENNMQQQIAQLDRVAAKRAFHLLLTGRYAELDARQRQSLPCQDKLFIVAWLCRDGDQPWTLSSPSGVTTEAVLAMLLDDLCEGRCETGAQREKESYAVLFGFSADTDPVECQLTALSICTRLMDRLAAHFDLTDMRAYIGDTQEGLENVHLSCKNAQRARDYAEFLPQEHLSRVLPFDPLMYSSNVPWQDYDIMDAERSFINLMLEGSYAQAEQVLHDIMTYYSTTDGMNLYVMRCRMFGVMNMMLNVLHEIEPDLTNEAFSNFSPVETLLSARSPSELEKIMFDIITKLVGAQEGKTSDSNGRVEQIQRYIATNYYDVNLSVQMVADFYDMSLPYLSRIFKKETGTGLLDYINRYRVKKAKAFLQATPEESIASVASRVGFNSSQTLIRTFKRYESITPGQYKQSLMAKTEDISGQK